MQFLSDRKMSQKRITSPEKKNYNININEEINKKINSINIVRNARIKSSERMQYYSKHWNRIFFIFNLLAILFVMTSLIKTDIKGFTEVTSFFTLYIIILQYYIAARNYNERSLRFHYHQLELEQNILELKEILINSFENNHIESKKNIELYLNIMTKYHINLQNIENHSEIDYKIGNKTNNKIEKILFGYNIGILSHYVVCLIVFMYFVKTVLIPFFK